MNAEFRKKLSDLLWHAEASVTDLEAEVGAILAEKSRGHRYLAKIALAQAESKRQAISRLLFDLDAQLKHEAECDTRMCQLYVPGENENPMD
jgi:hypothetical protein